jgi:DNA-binding response OmpR family regulator/two-component sensor histidine kinase
MNNLVDEVIDIRKQDQGFLKLKISKEDIVSLVKEICNSFYGYAQINHIDFQFNTELDKASLYIDKVQMEKVFYNLLSNAFKFTQSGDWIQVNIFAKGENDIVISVDNKGVGIDPSKIGHVFERFWQDESAKTVRQVSGSGIGLSMAKGIVELHHGEIEVKSEPHQVTSFKVTLHRDANATVADMKNEEELSNQNDYELHDITDIVKPDKSVKILIVEDNAEMRNVLAEIFKQIYEVETAANGQEGLDKAVMLQPQIIVSDIMMPVMSGLEMCEKLKSDMQTSHIPIVLLTARSREEHMLEGLQTGADDYISKPFSIKILVVRCHNIIMTRRLLQQRFAQSDKTITEELSINPIDKKILNDATAIVEAHINNINFDITLFSREICMSRTLLFTKLKALTGQTPNEFILSIRLKKACEALKKNPAALISNIAFDYGFSTPSYFIRCFKSVYGITPAAYRRNNIK